MEDGIKSGQPSSKNHQFSSEFQTANMNKLILLIAVTILAEISAVPYGSGGASSTPEWDSEPAAASYPPQPAAQQQQQQPSYPPPAAPASPPKYPATPAAPPKYPAPAPAPAPPAYPPAQPPAYPKPSKQEEQPPMPYKFEWAVKDEASQNDYAHEQESDGTVVTGMYRVALPDGRTQIVTYKADENGYVAEVTYEGEAQYPEPEAAAPAYPAPAPAAPAYPKPPAPGPAPAYPPPAPAAQPAYPPAQPAAQPSYPPAPAPAAPPKYPPQQQAAAPSYPPQQQQQTPVAPPPKYPQPKPAAQASKQY